MLYFSSRSHYEPINSDDKQDIMKGLQSNKAHRHIDFATSLVLLCGIVNVLLLASCVYRIYAIELRKPAPQFRDLKLQDTYVSLDTIFPKSSSTNISYGNIINHSRYFTQISSAQPLRIMPPNEQLYVDDSGRVPYYARRLVINSTISTFVQFRIMDYGMELCRLFLSVPPQNETKDISGAIGIPQRISIWEYPKAGLLDHRTLCWNTRPSQRKYFGSLETTYAATSQTHIFPCQSLSYQTFELACETDNCYVDVEGIGLQPSGLYMRQYQSL
ncbi:hypothetical protein HYPSUDRAFT_168610 [Hypholoma sublateritium FD-334 SS-4]|uniref:Ubiquitin 3 binding protein But2 C-terminal domain-containing protein n=1 Tax=Hypholoma sublateritium (strain FD-334 SS-4) TaxID=945553 RepID=A0A0D2NJB8_HYPSF|nr:hypothetical protein HYPSUDRAFT_168610 [Hypholoma sublateritium FD-334 SS-4]